MVNISNGQLQANANARDCTNTESLRRLLRSNVACSRHLWGPIGKGMARVLKELTTEHRLSVGSGDLLLLEGRWYVTHTGLLRLARRSRCMGISVEAVPELSDAAAGRWAFKATVFKTAKCKGFVGYGDADPSNVSSVVRGAEMRVAETRAVNRALRKAYGIGVCSLEEIGTSSGPLPPTAHIRPIVNAEAANGNDRHPLRDRLCLLIRQHQLDPVLVKAYAADYCQVSELRQASRGQVATFIKHLAEYAQSDREGLICELNSYAPKPPSSAVSTAPEAPLDEKSRGAA